jgi:hypothetical protein
VCRCICTIIYDVISHITVIFLDTSVGTTHSTSIPLIFSRYYITGTGYELDDRGIRFRVPGGPRIFPPSYRPDWFWGPSSLEWVPGALSPVVKRQGREAHHSPPTSAQVKKMWISTSTPPYASWRNA